MLLALVFWVVSPVVHCSCIRGLAFGCWKVEARPNYNGHFTLLTRNPNNGGMFLSSLTINYQALSSPKASWSPHLLNNYISLFLCLVGNGSHLSSHITSLTSFGGELMPYNIVYLITQKDSYGDIWSSHEWLKQNQVSRSPSRLLYKSNESGVV